MMLTCICSAYYLSLALLMSTRMLMSTKHKDPQFSITFFLIYPFFCCLSISLSLYFWLLFFYWYRKLQQICKGSWKPVKLYLWGPQMQAQKTFFDIIWCRPIGALVYWPIIHCHPYSYSVNLACVFFYILYLQTIVSLTEDGYYGREISTILKDGQCPWRKLVNSVNKCIVIW